MKLISNDKQEFEIDYDIAKQSTLLKPFAEQNADGPIPLADVKGSILQLIIDFCNYHKNDPEPEDIDDDDPNKGIYKPKRSNGMSEWDQTFIQQFNVQKDTLFYIIRAANYLGIKTLLDVGCKAVANMIQDKTPSEVREMFNITPSLPESSVNDLITSNETTNMRNATDSKDTALTYKTNSMNEQ